jgi:hypothetical protein
VVPITNGGPINLTTGASGAYTYSITYTPVNGIPSTTNASSTLTFPLNTSFNLSKTGVISANSNAVVYLKSLITDSTATTPTTSPIAIYDGTYMYTSSIQSDRSFDYQLAQQSTTISIAPIPITVPAFVGYTVNVVNGNVDEPASYLLYQQSYLSVSGARINITVNMKFDSIANSKDLFTIQYNDNEQGNFTISWTGPLVYNSQTFTEPGSIAVSSLPQPNAFGITNLTNSVQATKVTLNDTQGIELVEVLTFIYTT